MNQHIAREEVESSKSLPADGAEGLRGFVAFDPQEIRAAAIAASFREPRFALETLGAIKLDLEPQWLIEGLMPRTGLHVLYGAPGSGKSFLALSAASISRPASPGGVVA